MNDRVAPHVPPENPSASVLPFAAAIRLGLASGLVSHLPWLLTSRIEVLRGVSTLMPFVFLAFDPWLTVPLVLRVRRSLAARAAPAARAALASVERASAGGDELSDRFGHAHRSSHGSSRGRAVLGAACAGVLSGALTATNIVVWERLRLGAWLPTDDLLAHLVYPVLASVYAMLAVGGALLASNVARTERDTREPG